MQQKTVEKPELQCVTSKVHPEDCQINLSDFALFLSVMKVKEAYEDVLSIILDEADLKLKEVKAEQVILNKSGKRAIRLDAWALDVKDRQFDVEMQNDAESDDIRKRSRFYQGLIDTPILKAGRETRYKHLPSTVIIFITQDDIFGKDLAKYTFSEQCEEVADLPLEDGTKKIFLNMSSLNGRAELVSLLQYMKNTTLDNPNITVKDKRILDLDRIVGEIKQSEEWETVRMSILSIGLQQGIEQGLQQGLQQGIEQGISETLVKNVESAMKNFGIDLQKACKGLGTTIEEYDNAKKKIERFKNDKSDKTEYVKDEDNLDDEDIEMGPGYFFP
ncbi:MAG: Rpn family recombination-promoting nuclease/putative transposase [Lachnospiraceae bacterium]|nr:Rpn family recombination-promoting nuclease/putative transposase [Lachnospiraceae bacterium]